MHFRRPGLSPGSSMHGFALFLCGWGRSCAFWRFVLQQSLAAEPDLAGGIDVDDLHEDLLTLLQLIAYVLHAVIRDLRDVKQTIGAGHDLDERTEVSDALHLAHVGLIELGRGREFLDDANRLGGGFTVR